MSNSKVATLDTLKVVMKPEWNYVSSTSVWHTFSYDKFKNSIHFNDMTFIVEIHVKRNYFILSCYRNSKLDRIIRDGSVMTGGIMNIESFKKLLEPWCRYYVK